MPQCPINFCLPKRSFVPSAYLDLHSTRWLLIGSKSTSISSSSTAAWSSSLASSLYCVHNFYLGALPYHTAGYTDTLHRELFPPCHHGSTASNISAHSDDQVLLHSFLFPPEDVSMPLVQFQKQWHPSTGRYLLCLNNAQAESWHHKDSLIFLCGMLWVSRELSFLQSTTRTRQKHSLYLLRIQ